jgi:hypothetical protein
MSATVTAIGHPCVIGEDNKISHYTIAFDSKYPATTGEAIDLTDDFTYIHNILIGGHDTLTDGKYKFDAIWDSSSAITSSNVVIAAHWSNSSATVLAEVTNDTDLSGVGALHITVFGR